MKFARGIPVVQVEPLQGSTQHIAQWISQIGSPPLTTLAGAAFLFSTGPIFWTEFALFAIFSVCAPLVYVWWLLRSGAIGDMHMMHRRERIKPLVVTCASNLIGFLVLYWGDWASTLHLFVLVQCIIALVFLGITPWFKISLHSASAVVLFLLSVSLTDYVVAPLMTLVMICWSRLFLRRHTLLQVLAGCALGGAVWAAVW